MPVSDLSSSDDDNQAVRQVPRRNDPGALVPGHCPIGAGQNLEAWRQTFRAPVLAGAGAVAVQPAQTGADVQEEMAQLFKARRTHAAGAMPLFRDAGSACAAERVLRHYDKDRLLVMTAADLQRASGGTDSPKGLLLRRQYDDGLAVYTLFHDGQQVQDPAYLKVLLAYLRSALALPAAAQAPAARVAPGEKVSAAERAFQREAANVFASRYTRCAAAIPVAALVEAARKRQPQLVRDLSVDNALFIRATQEPADARRGLGLIRQADGRFTLLRDGVELTNAKERSLALREVRRCLGMAEERKPAAHASGRPKLARDMDHLIRQVRVSKGQQNVPTIDGARIDMEILALDYPGGKQLHDHVVKSHNVVLKWDKILNHGQVNGVPTSARAAAAINSAAHDVLNRFGLAPLSRTVVASKEVELGNGQKGATTTQFTGGQYVQGREVGPLEQRKAANDLKMMLYIVGATDVLDPVKGRVIAHNVVIDPRNQQKAIDLFDEKDSTDRPAMFRRSTRLILGMPKARVADELERARAHAHRRLDRSMGVLGSQEVQTLRNYVNRYLDDCRERLMSL